MIVADYKGGFSDRLSFDAITAELLFQARMPKHPFSGFTPMLFAKHIRPMLGLSVLIALD